MIRLMNLIYESVYDTNEWYHGSPSGDLRGGISGLHLGTFKAAKEALESRIGIPVEGEWDGKREYGKTMLCGKITLKEKHIFPTGFNVDVPDNDFIPDKPPKHAQYLLLTMKPAIKKYKILCPMVNYINSPYTDSAANARMKGLIKRGQGKRGIYYRNEGEDSGSISVVVPNGTCVKEL